MIRLTNVNDKRTGKTDVTHHVSLCTDANMAVFRWSCVDGKHTGRVYTTSGLIRCYDNDVIGFTLRQSKTALFHISVQVDTGQRLHVKQMAEVGVVNNRPVFLRSHLSGITLTNALLCINHR